MSRHKKNVGDSGKEPDNPTVIIPNELINALTFYVQNNTLETVKKDIRNAIVFSLMANQLDGKFYGHMTENLFEVIELLEEIYKHIPDPMAELKVA